MLRRPANVATGDLPVSRAELRHLIREWPLVMRNASDHWAKEFANSIWRQSGQPNWRPSLMQLRVMRKMVRELAACTNADGTPKLIED